MDFMRSRMPATHIILLAILPRGSLNATNNPFSDIITWPNEYTAGIAEMAERFQGIADKDSFVHFLACPSASSFLSRDGNINPRLLPDGLHPSAAGMELLAKCLEPAVGQFLGSGPQQATQG